MAEVSLLNSEVVWTTGPHLCDAMNDQNIFNSSLRERLSRNEYVLKDRGHKG